MRRCLVGLLGLFVLIAGTLSGCGEDPPVQRKHTIDNGPLAALAPGAKSYQTSGSPTIVTFGAVTLCSDDPKTNIELKAVRYEARPAPTNVKAWLRIVPTIGARGRGSKFDWRPMIVAPGYPGHLRRGPWRGAYKKKIAGFSVDRPCFGASDLDNPRVELLTALKVGPQGTAVKKIFIDYHVAERDYTLVVAGKQLVCGTKVRAGC